MKYIISFLITLVNIIILTFLNLFKIKIQFLHSKYNIYKNIFLVFDWLFRTFYNYKIFITILKEGMGIHIFLSIQN